MQSGLELQALMRRLEEARGSDKKTQAELLYIVVTPDHPQALIRNKS